jgi:hypothetical protein
MSNSGKVKCTCGWSWNKSDSSKKDMYICHECGRDNSNNMKNGGWLDNYNDSQASAPEGMEGDGFSNVGRNYSPAWGGQFQNGGKTPLYVESKNDPRYKAYQDSLTLYNNYNDLKKSLSSQEYENLGSKGQSFENALKFAKLKRGNKDRAEIKKEQNSLYSLIDFIPGQINRTLPRQLYSESIEPKSMDEYRAPSFYFKEDTVPGRPHDARRVANYSNVKPQQEVIVKPTTTKETTKPIKPPVQQKRQSIKAIQNNLQPAGLVQGDFNIDADAEIHPEVRRAKSWKYNTREGRSEESGYVNSPEDMDYYTRLKDFYQTGAGKGLGNKVEITPQYQMGGSVYPVNYVPQAAMGGTIAGAVGFSYARTQSPAPSNGKYAKKTMASAQNGKEMQYYQNGLDFQPKSISKNGGWLSKYDKAQTGKQVEYGTPEYREAYNRGEVVTDEGGRSPIQLDEVIVNKKSPAPGFWKQSRDRYLEEHQDDGILGAIGSVATYPLGVAQQAMMYGLTGKVQTPTEGMGIRKGMEGLPGTILNTVADPVMFMGELGKAPELLKSGVRALGTEEGLLSNAYKLNPYAFKPNESNWYRQVGKSAVDDVLDTGLVREAGEEVSPRMWGEFQDQIKRLQGDDALPHFEKMKQQMLAGRRPVAPFFNKGELFYPMGRKPVINKTTGKLSKNPAGAGSADYLIETALPNESFQPAYVKGMSLGVPEEIGSTAILKPNPELRNLENFNLYKKNWLQGYKQVPKKEDGGIIKDDRGQWDHPGEITEINSNDITMEGVPYDVLGISDTGDTKLMKPGKNYKFKGKKVTEYPMAKNGLRQEQKGLQNLDNLTNFTNYNKPQPGSWLEKYN